MSTNRRIYLDFNATAPLVPAAREALVEALGHTGNPSSIHAEGRQMRDRVERARNQVAALVGRPREQIVFTSGGTEANALGVLALARVAEARGLPRVVVTTPIEHPSLRGAVQSLVDCGWRAHELTMKPWGDIELPAVAEVGLVACALVNHEIGTVAYDLVGYPAAGGHPPRVGWARERGALLHVDAVQAAGKLALSAFDADSLAISGHKLGAPQGIGALAITLDEELPIVEGGHQERGRRPGTENVLGIIGMGAAATAANVADWDRVVELGKQLERGLYQVDELVSINGAGGARIGGTINASFAGARGDSIVMALDLAGISVSTGAACTSGSIQPSAVLLGLGFSAEDARRAVRFSLGRTTTSDEIEEVLRALPLIIQRARRHN
jgi:cysteine desulfurase